MIVQSDCTHTWHLRHSPQRDLYYTVDRRCSGSLMVIHVFDLGLGELGWKPRLGCLPSLVTLVCRATH